MIKFIKKIINKILSKLNLKIIRLNNSVSLVNEDDLLSFQKNNLSHKLYIEGLRISKNEKSENLNKQNTKRTKKEMKKIYGKDSKEFLEAQAAHLKAKEADRQGAEGGRKQGIFRKWSSKRNKKRQEKNQAEMDDLNVLGPKKDRKESTKVALAKYNKENKI